MRKKVRYFQILVLLALLLLSITYCNRTNQINGLNGVVIKKVEGTIKKVDIRESLIGVSLECTNKDFDGKKVVFNCKNVTINDIKIGDRVEIEYLSDAPTIVEKINKYSQSHPKEKKVVDNINEISQKTN